MQDLDCMDAIKPSSLIILLSISLLWPARGTADTGVSPPDTTIPIVIAAGEYPPWLSSEFVGGGFLGQVIAESFEYSGYKTKLAFQPWKRGYEQTKSGYYFASAYWYPSKKHEQHFIYSAPIHTENTHFFYHVEKPLEDWKALSDLAPFKIGATDGYTYTETFWNASQQGIIDVELANRDGLNMAKLLRRRIDLFPVEKFLGLALVKNSTNPNAASLIRYHPTPLLESTGHLLFSKAHPDTTKLLKAFNNGLIRLKESGRYDELRNTLVIKQ